METSSAEASLLSLPLDTLCLVFSHVAVRDVLACSCVNKQLHAVCQDDTLWRELAEHKWGRRVRDLARLTPEQQAGGGGWQAWCRHRMAWVSLPPSPLDLVQEHYPDPWRHLAACLLCSRTTGGPVIREAITALLARWPSPSAVLDAPEAQLLEAMHPLGLQVVRCAALRSMSHDFLGRDWADPTEFKGCGKFTCDSWRIFCRGHRELKDVEDVNLCRFLRWLVKGEVPGDKKGQKARTGSKKRKAEAPAEAGTLRSGRRRGDAGASGSASAPTPERRQTRSMAVGGTGSHGR